MSPVEKTTYFGYNEGFEPTILPIGTLAFDYANPRTKQPHIHSATPDLFKPTPLATADSRPLCSMGYGGSAKQAFSFGLDGLLEFSFGRDETKSRIVVGKNGSKVQLINPHTFLTTNVLSDSAAKTWLETRLSVVSALQRKYKNTFAPPKIWMLTGLYYMEDATVYHLRSKSKEGGTSVKAPLPDPTGTAALLGLNLGATISLGQTTEGQAVAQILGKKVWAAQWTQLYARYLDPSAPDEQKQLAINKLKLLDVWSAGTERDAGEEHIAVVSLEEVDDGHTKPAAAEYDEKVWDDFDRTLEVLLEDL